MTQSQIPLAVRRKGLKAVRARRTEDPELRRMLATHIHCGEPMQLVGAGAALPYGGPEVKYDGGLRTFRCACGFSFDQRKD